ncbi:MAG: hypothetical protein AB1490_05370 [Pseudomonadota bacterium]
MAWGRRNTAEKKLSGDIQNALSALKDLVPLPRNEQTLRFLEAVYKRGRLIKLSGNLQAQRILQDMAPEIRMKGDFNRFRILIHLAAREADINIKSTQRDRYGRALQKAHKDGVKSRELRDYLIKRGINKLGDTKPA